MAVIEFDKILEDFIEIPNGLYKCLQYYLSPEGKEIFNTARAKIKKMKIRTIFFIGHSYNFFASFLPFYYLNSQFKKSTISPFKNKECIIYEIDEFLNYFRPRSFLQDSIFLFISQSGNSLQIKQGVRLLWKHNIEKENIWGLTNNSESFLSKNTQYTFLTKSGQEQMYGIKSYPNTLLVLYFLARLFSDAESITPQIEEEIRNLIFEIRFYGNDWDYHTSSIINFLGEDYDFLYFISKGTSLCTAQQAAQSCKAYARTFGEGIKMGLFMRGPFQIVDENFRCVLIVSDEVGLDDILNAIDTITKKMGKGKVVLINNSRKLSSLGRANPNVWVFEHSTKNSYLAPIFEINMLQFVLLQRSKQLGIVD